MALFERRAIRIVVQSIPRLDENIERGVGVFDHETRE
jgi:hypothetical protein